MTDDLEDDATLETIGKLKKPVKSVNELYSHYLPALAARIWETCCWPHRMADGWKIGDFRFIVLSVSPEPKTELYVQFWSEPREQVLAEVCSGEWSPAAVSYVREPQRRLLRALSFKKGGQANNFGKIIDVRNVREAEGAARETLRIFFDVFGFRGQWPVQIRCERGERAELRPVFSSMTPEDLAKLFGEYGYTAIVPDVDDTAIVLLKRGRRRFTARLDGRVPGENMYRVVVLDAMLEPRATLSEGDIVTLTNEIAGVTICPVDASLRLSMLMLLEGGVTDEWMLRGVEYFLACVRRCEQRLRQEPTRSVGKRPPPERTVH